MMFALEMRRNLFFDSQLLLKNGLEVFIIIEFRLEMIRRSMLWESMRLTMTCLNFELFCKKISIKQVQVRL